MWIYFSSFTQYSLVEPRRVESGEREEEGSSAAPPSAGAAGAAGASCGVELRVWDAAGALGRYCDSAPALCARAALANATRAPRPCAPPDGYVSRGALLALSAASRAGTATHPLGFALHYEFVDARVPGAALASRGAAPPQCARPADAGRARVAAQRAVVRARRRAAPALRVPAAGRGARDARPRARDVRPRAALRVARAPAHRPPRVLPAARGGGARGRRGPRVGRRRGRRAAARAAPEDLRVAVARLPGECGARGRAARGLGRYSVRSPQVPLACLCDNASAPLQLEARGGALELVLAARSLRAAEDHRHVGFSGEWRASPGPPCAARRRLPPPGAHLDLAYPYRLAASASLRWGGFGR